MTTLEPAISPAHRALAIQELVAAIVAHADEPSTVALACTSRGLCEPALDSLWERPPIWELARRMSPDLYDITFHADEFTLVRRYIRWSSLWVLS
jgi:Fe-S oxidoreductase